MNDNYGIVMFGSLKIGEEFECFGDQLINYDYPKICKCIKTGEDSAREIDGVNFFVNQTSFVLLPRIKSSQ